MRTRSLLTTTLLIAACGRTGAGAPAAQHTVDPGETITVVEPKHEASSSRLEPPKPLAERTIRVDGGLTESQVRDEVQSHFAEIRDCFDGGLVGADAVDTRGAIVVAFDVDAAGATQHVALEASEYHDAMTERCIVAAVDGWHLAKPKGGSANVSYPFYLRSF